MEECIPSLLEEVLPLDSMEALVAGYAHALLHGKRSSEEMHIGIAASHLQTDPW